MEIEAENKKSSLKFLGGMNKYFDSEWSFAKYNVNCPVAVCRFAGNDSLVVLCADGQYYKFKVLKDELVKESFDSMLNEK